MLVKNQKTNQDFYIGEVINYNNIEYKIIEEYFKIKSIVNTPKAIAVTLINKEGETVPCNFWNTSFGYDPNIYMDENNKLTLTEIGVNDTVRMVGHYYLYKEHKQFRDCGGYQLVDTVMEYKAEFSDDCLEELTKLLKLIKSDKLWSACNEALECYKQDFITKPAASGHHHNYVGGLLLHTAEVMKFAYTIANTVECNMDNVLTAAFFHDIDKIKEYTIEGDYLPFARQIGHVTGSAMTFNRFANMFEVEKRDIEAITHCILAHHGELEWGSPVVPVTPEAVIVHEADMLSSRLNPMFTTLRSDLVKDYYIKW